MQLQLWNIRDITTVAIALRNRILRLQVNALPGHPHHSVIGGLHRIPIFIIFNQILDILFILLEILVVGRY